MAIDRRLFEQGPIRPPSEAYSLLIRATRNCTWNKCSFCHIYKGKKFEKRSVQEVKSDIQAAKAVADEIKALSWKSGYGGEISRDLIETIFTHSHLYNDHFRSIALWLYFGGKNVFLQDANSITLNTSELVEILEFLKAEFPHIERITSYGRSRTIAKRKSVEELGELKKAGLTRLHVGLESGWDFLLKYMNKGVTASEHIEAGRKVMASGIELSEYVVLGLGGKRWWREHALETAKVLNQISPHFIRLRTLRVLPQMPLQIKIDEGDFVLQTEEEMIVEEKLLVETLNGIASTFMSDHALNLLMEVEGNFPEEKAKMLNIIDAFLALPPDEKLNFRLGKRAGIYTTMEDMSDPMIHRRVEELLERLESETPGGVETAISTIKDSFL